MRTTALALALLLTLGVSGCGSNDTTATSDGGGDALSRYCSLVKASTGAVLPSPPASLTAHPDAGAIRSWLHTALAPELERTTQVVGVAPSNVRADWVTLQSAQQSLVDNLESFLLPAHFEAWQKLGQKERAVKFLEAVLLPFKGMDKTFVQGLQAEVKADCGIDLANQ